MSPPAEAVALAGRPGEPPSPSLAQALAARARRSPSDPFLFFRDDRDRVRWWSFARAAESAGAPPDVALSAGAPGEIWAELLAWMVGSPPAGSGRAPSDRDPAAALGRRLVAFSTPAPRPIWVAWRPLSVAAERASWATAVLGGHAVFLEPHADRWSESVAWARPTWLTATAEELLALADGLESLAPRGGRRRWLRRRLDRVDRLWLEGSSVLDAPLARRLAELGLDAIAAVRPLPPVEESATD